MKRDITNFVRTGMCVYGVGMGVTCTCNLCKKAAKHAFTWNFSGSVKFKITADRITLHLLSSLAQSIYIDFLSSLFLLRTTFTIKL